MKRLFALGSLVLVTACASEGRTGFGDEPPSGAGEQQPGGDLGKAPPPPTESAAEVAEVFGHSAKTLYRLDPVTKAVTTVGDFQGCKDVIDIALNEKAQLYGVSYDTLYQIDKKTAECTVIGTGQFPNSLSFVPAGTVDANEEALVGYDESTYVRIDLSDGSKTTKGTIGSGLVSSGDIVSVKGGSTYLTVKGGSCTTYDCLVEVNPATGKMIKNWGSIEHKKVFGLSFWAGKLYGFDETGNLFEVTFGTNQLATTAITIPQKPAGLSFWGAGSTTSAPLVAAPQ